MAGESRVDAVWEVQQRSRDELDAAQISESLWNGFFLPGTDLDTSDAVEDEELGTFEFVGAPWPARDPFSQTESHVEATLRLVAGPEDAS